MVCPIYYYFFHLIDIKMRYQDGHISYLNEWPLDLCISIPTFILLREENSASPCIVARIRPVVRFSYRTESCMKQVPLVCLDSSPINVR